MGLSDFISCSAFLLADLAFLATHQAADVVLVADHGKHGEAGGHHGNMLIGGEIECNHRRCDDAQDRSQRGVAENPGNQQPHRTSHHADWPGHHQQCAQCRGDPFAALELEPDREVMANDGGECRDDAGKLAQLHEDQCCDGTLGGIKDQCHEGQKLVSGPKHVGGADVSRPDGADITKTGHPRQHQSPRDRAEQVADQSGQR